jgi:hypothetical protein
LATAALQKGNVAPGCERVTSNLLCLLRGTENPPPSSRESEANSAAAAANDIGADDRQAAGRRFEAEQDAPGDSRNFARPAERSTAVQAVKSLTALILFEHISVCPSGIFSCQV